MSLLQNNTGFGKLLFWSILVCDKLLSRENCNDFREAINEACNNLEKPFMMVASWFGANWCV